MKLIAWQWLAASSLLLGALATNAETRPQYGGTLHVSVHAAPTSLDPADPAQTDSFLRRNLSLLLFNRLTTTDENGRVKGELAESWQASRGNQSWEFRLRGGLEFHDGTPLSAEVAAASLRYANPAWNVTTENDVVVIDCPAANPELPTELALVRNSIVRRSSNGTVSGTGPFFVLDWQPGKKLQLAAEENYWGGRAFLDGIEIEMGKDYRGQMTALELGKADLVEVAPELARRVSQERVRLASSSPMELVALVFSREAVSPEEKTVRAALAWSVDRASIRNVLLQGTGQPSGALLPTWMSGYGFVFALDADLTQARQLRDEVQNAGTWKLGYDGNDAMARLLAERIALNARDAGLSVQPTSSAGADLRMVRIPLASAEPWIALEELNKEVGFPSTGQAGGSAEELYASEQAELAKERVIPLFHLPVTYAAAQRLRNWTLRSDGSWDLTDAWLESGAR